MKQKNISFSLNVCIRVDSQHDFDAADTKQCSFSLPQLIKTNPALTPCCFPRWITVNLLLMTDCGGWVQWACKRWWWWKRKMGSFEQHLVFEVLTLWPLLHTILLPPRFSSPLITESALADKRRRVYKVPRLIMQHASGPSMEKEGFHSLSLSLECPRGVTGSW